MISSKLPGNTFFSQLSLLILISTAHLLPCSPCCTKSFTMTAVVAINPNQISEGFANGTKTFIRAAPVAFKATTEQKPAPAFVLNDVTFVGLQSYVKSALKIPKTDELFKATYPFKGLDLWIQTQSEYDVSDIHLWQPYWKC